jgi:hypothetical protein
MLVSGSSHRSQSSNVPKSSSRIGSSTLADSLRLWDGRSEVGRSGSESIEVVGVVMLDVLEKISLTKSRSRPVSCGLMIGLFEAQDIVVELIASWRSMLAECVEYVRKGEMDQRDSATSNRF